jgi:hypothetical protein
VAVDIDHKDSSQALFRHGRAALIRSTSTVD